MDTKDGILKMFGEGFNCSQIVLAHFAEDFRLNSDIALKIGSGFGAGMGRMATVCGAVTGAFMVLGLKHGFCMSAEPQQSKETIYALVRTFSETFENIHGSIMCRQLLGGDISTAEGYAMANEKGLFRTLCPKYVEDSIKILEAML